MQEFLRYFWSLNYGANADARKTNGLTPFYLATQGGLAEVQRVLLEHAADPGEIPASVSTPVTSPAESLTDLLISTNSGEISLSQLSVT